MRSLGVGRTGPYARLAWLVVADFVLLKLNHLTSLIGAAGEAQAMREGWGLAARTGHHIRGRQRVMGAAAAGAQTR